MAELKKGIPISGGSVADFTVYERLGKVVVRQRHRRKGYGERTMDSLGQKTKYRNVVDSWSCFDGALKGLFELKRPGQSDYNAFTANNLIDARVYLTQREAARHYAVLDHFVVSKGTLEPVVEVEMRDDIMLSNIALKDLDRLDLETRVCDLAYAIVQGNKGYFRYGDELIFLRAKAYWMKEEWVDMYPGFRTKRTVVPLDSRCRLTLRSLLNVEEDEQRFADGLLMREGRLACARAEFSMVAWVHRRRLEGKQVAVSTQRLVGENDEMLSYYTSDDQRLSAIQSYKPEGGDPMRSSSGNLPVLDPVPSTDKFTIGDEL